MRRRRRELEQYAIATAYAFNEPKRLNRILPRIAPVPSERPGLMTHFDEEQEEAGAFTRSWKWETEPERVAESGRDNQP